MATTTPNFGWAVPTSSDLVKNGATAIETLGDSIDASLVDLKGGTTGQVLAKATNTDMDFTWSTPSAGSTYVAGKNFVINGGMDIWQRGATGLGTSTGSYTADRWVLGSSSTTVTRDTDVPTSPYFQYSLKMVGTGANSIVTKLESAISTRLAGETVTFSFYAKRTAGAGNLDVRFYYPSATDNFASVTQIGSTSVVSASPSSSWTRYSVTVAIGTNITTGLQILINNDAGSGSTTFITGAQLEIASTASAFSRNASTIQGELAACQRYYYRMGGSAAYQRFGSGTARSTTAGEILTVLPVTMRTRPTSIDFSTLTLDDTFSVASSVTNAVIDSSTSGNNVVNTTCTSSGLTQARFYYLEANNSTSAYLGFSAEL